MDENLIIEENILKGYRESEIITVTIPEGIVAISDNAFSDFPNLHSVSLPKSLLMIGDGAFKNCTSLTSIDLTNVCSVGAESFSGCTVLNNVEFGKKIKYLPNALFLGCTGLTGITLPENITYVGSECFKDCTSLTDIKVCGVMEIDNNAFENCNSLCSIALPYSLFHISDNAFSFCRSLTAITVNNSLVDIDETAFCYNVDLVFKATQNSTAQGYAADMKYKFQPVILNDEYRVITNEHLEILSVSGIMFHAKKMEGDTGRYIIHYDKTAEQQIISLIGGDDAL